MGLFGLSSSLRLLSLLGLLGLSTSIRLFGLFGLSSSLGLSGALVYFVDLVCLVLMVGLVRTVR